MQRPKPPLEVSGQVDPPLLDALRRFADERGLSAPPQAGDPSALDPQKLQALLALLLGELDPQSLSRALAALGSPGPSRAAPAVPNPRAGTSAAPTGSFPLSRAINTGAAPQTNAFTPPRTAPAPTAGAPSTTPVSGAAPANPADRKVIQESAQKLLQLHAEGKVKFWDGLSTGSELRKVQALAAGKPAVVDKTGEAVWPDARMMQALVEMAQLPGGIHINALTGGGHSVGSNHYSGHAVDLDLNTGNAAQIAAIAARYGGRRNSERDHIHLDSL